MGLERVLQGVVVDGVVVALPVVAELDRRHLHVQPRRDGRRTKVPNIGPRRRGARGREGKEKFLTIARAAHILSGAEPRRTATNSRTRGRTTIEFGNTQRNPHMIHHIYKMMQDSCPVLSNLDPCDSFRPEEQKP